MPSPTTMKSKKKKKSNTQSTPDFFTVSKKALIGATAAICASILLSLVSAAISLFSPDPASLTLPIGLAVFFLSSAIGGAVSALGLKNSPVAAIASAVLCGFILVIITGICAVWQASAAPEASHNLPPVLSLVLRLTSLPTAALPAYLITKSNKKHRHRRR